ncbi:hypothetical protein [Sinobaca sp. H24]|uniref:hypothetical protein n=1 Tax=Sinobaca sp. H24 TaxID=2923376 RepID=UPI002079DAA9|nr:hypothetical protein [Sinobaca sp. H24]
MKGKDAAELEKSIKEIEAVAFHNRDTLIDVAKSVEVLKEILIKQELTTEEDFAERKESIEVPIDKYIK